MLQAGAVILTTWNGINCLLAVLVLSATAFSRGHPLMARIVFADEEMNQLSEKAEAIIEALSNVASGGVAAFSLLSIQLIWMALVQRQAWAFWGLLVTMGISQLVQFLIGAIVGYKTVLASMAMAVLYLLGMGLASYALAMS